jgi:hypothetical protein
MICSKSIPVFLVATAVCLGGAASDASAQGRGHGRGPSGRGPSVGRAAPRVYGGGPRVYGPSRGYGPSRYYGGGRRYISPVIVGYSAYRPYYYGYRPGITIGFYSGYGYPYGYPYYRSYGGYYGYGYGGYGYGSGYGYGPYGYPLPPPAYVSAQPGVAYGGVRIQNAPRDAQVFADGYYMGIVDDFDGAFQHLNLEAGAHQIEIRIPGVQPFAFDVNVQPGQTVTLHVQ